ncbi:MAG: TIGR00375 family protein, partial [Bacillota bacterium]
LKPRVTNLSLSSQKCSADPGEVVESVARLGGFCVPAHVFTPHRGVLGACADRLASVFDASSLDSIPAVELGLSADTDMADTIDEMAEFTFLSNSDAHSKATIARECNLLVMNAPGFSELESSLRRRGSRKVGANYGLDPRLGKYHRTLCLECGRPALGGEAAECPACGSSRVVRGVWDRVRRIASYDHPVHPAHRPPYIHQVPLSFIPGVGPKTLDRMIARFGSEMNALHQATRDELVEVVGEAVAGRVIAAREGRLKVRPGAGGSYGSITSY